MNSISPPAEIQSGRFALQAGRNRKSQKLRMWKKYVYIYIYLKRTRTHTRCGKKKSVGAEARRAAATCGSLARKQNTRQKKKLPPPGMENIMRKQKVKAEAQVDAERGVNQILLMALQIVMPLTSLSARVKIQTHSVCNSIYSFPKGENPYFVTLMRFGVIFFRHKGSDEFHIV